MKVFTKTELSERRFPKEGAQRSALNLVHPHLLKLYQDMKGVLSAAVLIGSSPFNAHNQPSITSDMDILLFVEDGDGSTWRCDRAALERTLSVVRTTVRNDYFLPLEFLLVLKSQMEPTQRRYDKQFLRHAVWALDWGGLLCGREEEVKHFHKLCPELEVSTALTYIDRKVAKTNTGLATLWSLTEEEKVRLQADLLNAAFHAARRMFTLAKVDYVDSRSGLIMSAREFGEERLEEHLKYLRRFGDQYRQYVIARRDRKPSGNDPFGPFETECLAEEFFGAMKRIREICVAVGT